MAPSIWQLGNVALRQLLRSQCPPALSVCTHKFICHLYNQTLTTRNEAKSLESRVKASYSPCTRSLRPCTRNCEGTMLAMPVVAAAEVDSGELPAGGLLGHALPSILAPALTADGGHPERMAARQHL